MADPSTPKTSVYLGRRWQAALVIATIAVALLLIGHRDPRTHGLGVMCPSKRWLGLYCPGCGSTRATYDLLHGEWASAWANNPAAVLLGAPVVLWSLAQSATVLVTGRHPRGWVPSRAGLWLAIGLLLYAVGRNLPMKAFDGWRPPTYAEPPQP